VQRADVLELVRGTGLVDGKEAEDVVTEVKLKPKAKPSRGAAAPVVTERIKDETAKPARDMSRAAVEARLADERTGAADSADLAAAQVWIAEDKANAERAKAVSTPPATQGTAPVRQPRNADARLAALGYPAEVIAGMSKEEKRRILPESGAEIPYVKAEAEQPTPVYTYRAPYDTVARDHAQPAPARTDLLDEADALIKEKDERIAELERVIEERDAEVSKLEERLASREKALLTAQQEVGARAAPAGLTLYVDCAPEDGDGHDLDALLAPFMRKAEAEGYVEEKTGKRIAPVPYYDAMPYNNGQKIVAGYLLSNIKAVTEAGAVVVDSRSPMAARAMEILRPLAARVVVGRAR
jgi:hypothetical protein